MVLEYKLSGMRLQTLTIPRLTLNSSSGKSRDSITLDCLSVCLPGPRSSQRLAWDTCRIWCKTHTDTHTCLMIPGKFSFKLYEKACLPTKLKNYAKSGAAEKHE